MKIDEIFKMTLMEAMNYENYKNAKVFIGRKTAEEIDVDKGLRLSDSIPREGGFVGSYRGIEINIGYFEVGIKIEIEVF